jgi:predicted O-linked N-acetylglucosamine transferase (SPINDLY family)
MPKPRHLRRMGLADLVLDTRIYNGHTTTSDALWAGVPVLTLRGSHFASRVSASILTAFGQPALITETLDGYRDLAVALAGDRARLAALKQETARLKTGAPLFDTKIFARDLERGYAEMWRRYRGGEPASRIDIAGL